jgi:hypothetical protein
MLACNVVRVVNELSSWDIPCRLFYYSEISFGLKFLSFEGSAIFLFIWVSYSKYDVLIVES